jgi:hypothetical protein
MYVKYIVLESKAICSNLASVVLIYVTLLVCLREQCHQTFLRNGPQKGVWGTQRVVRSVEFGSGSLFEG